MLFKIVATEPNQVPNYTVDTLGLINHLARVRQHRANTPPQTIQKILTDIEITQFHFEQEVDPSSGIQATHTNAKFRQVLDQLTHYFREAAGPLYDRYQQKFLEKIAYLRSSFLGSADDPTITTLRENRHSKKTVTCFFNLVSELTYHIGEIAESSGNQKQTLLDQLDAQQFGACFGGSITRASRVGLFITPQVVESLIAKLIYKFQLDKLVSGGNEIHIEALIIELLSGDQRDEFTHLGIAYRDFPLWDQVIHEFLNQISAEFRVFATDRLEEIRRLGRQLNHAYDHQDTTTPGDLNKALVAVAQPYELDPLSYTDYVDHETEKFRFDTNRFALDWLNAYNQELSRENVLVSDISQQVAPSVPDTSGHFMYSVYASGLSKGQVNSLFQVYRIAAESELAQKPNLLVWAILNESGISGELGKPFNVETIHPQDPVPQMIKTILSCFDRTTVYINDNDDRKALVDGLQRQNPNPPISQETAGQLAPMLLSLYLPCQWVRNLCQWYPNLVHSFGSSPRDILSHPQYVLLISIFINPCLRFWKLQDLSVSLPRPDDTPPQTTYPSTTPMLIQTIQDRHSAEYPAFVLGVGDQRPGLWSPNSPHLHLDTNIG